MNKMSKSQKSKGTFCEKEMSQELSSSQSNEVISNFKRNVSFCSRKIKIYMFII